MDILFENGTIRTLERNSPAAQALLVRNGRIAAVGSRAAVDALTSRLRADGYPVLSGPRLTGVGYYEGCILDREGNQIELTE